MHLKISKEEIFQLISSIQNFENVAISEEGVAYKLLLSSGNKAVENTWPYELGEVFFSYFQNEEIIFEDWFECLEKDETKDFVEYIELVAERFIKNETKIATKGFLFRRNELQYFSGSIWQNVLHP
jgi:hypothetical protein